MGLPHPIEVENVSVCHKQGNISQGCRQGWPLNPLYFFIIFCPPTRAANSDNPAVITDLHNMNQHETSFHFICWQQYFIISGECCPVRDPRTFSDRCNGNSANGINWSKSSLMPLNEAMTLHRLYAMKLFGSPNCTLCSSNVWGTFFHMIWECPGIADFWAVKKLNSYGNCHPPFPISAPVKLCITT